MKYLNRILFIALVSVVFASVIIAQNNPNSGSPWLVSVKPGAVNYVNGLVKVKRNDSVRYLSKGDSVGNGERVITESGARVEILLNPGSYARLDDHTEFEFLDNNLDNLELMLYSGTAIFEVFATKDFWVTVTTPQTEFFLVKSGVYRIDVDKNGESRIEVRRGKARVGSLDAKSLKKSKAAIVNGSSAVVSRFDRDDRDEFEEWSRARAMQLSQANASLTRNSNVRNSLWNGFVSRRWDTFGSRGLWAYSAQYGGYCYLPFSNGRSPYGFGLNRNLDYFRLPEIVYYVPRVRRNYDGAGVSGNTTNAATAYANRGANRRKNRSDSIDGSRRTRNASAGTSSRRRSPSATGSRSSGQARGRRSSSPRRQPRAAPRRSRPAPSRSTSTRSSGTVTRVRPTKDN